MVARLALLLLLVGSAHGEADNSELLRTALNACDEAVAVQRDDPHAAADLYRVAADAFQQVRAAGYENAALFYNLGNVHFRLGHVGQAIAHYRRAAQYEPANRTIRANLAYARERVEPAIEAGDEQELLQRVLFWQYGTNQQTRLYATLLFGGVGWLALGVWLRWRKNPLLVGGVVAVLLGFANAGLLASELRGQQVTPAGVIVGDSYVLRLGRGDGHDAALSEPLGPGVELQIQQQRADWYEVRLANGTVGWLPSEGVQRIDQL